jgi:hypothetical protein
MRRETEEYRVWQESYHIDRRFYEAISKNPPPRYHPPRPYEGHFGGAGAAVAFAGLTFYWITRVKGSKTGPDSAAATTTTLDS